jgi:hypothetical protein
MRPYCTVLDITLHQSHVPSASTCSGYVHSIGKLRGPTPTDGVTCEQCGCRMVRVQGAVLYNGKPLNKRAKRQVGYVMQVRR